MQVNNEIQKIMDEIHPILNVCNIPESSIIRLYEIISKLDDEEQIFPILEWLKNFKNGPVKDVQDIYELQPPEWWRNMQLFGMTDSREFHIFYAAKRRLRNSWRRKNARNGKANSTNVVELSIQSEGQGTNENCSRCG